ncbi:MAG: type IV secretion system DNA-binding domain-containing protein [Candidatus Falkowbacteria bacterium]
MENNITIFAATNFRNSFQHFGIKQDDRRRHMYLIGKTGMGKSVLQENMIINDIQAGYGIAVVDPHGDLVEKVVKYIPPHRINDVIYFNPSDIDHPVAFNVVEKVKPEYRHLVASGLIGIFQKLWADSWGPRLEYILRNAILAILDYPDSTLMGVTRMLSDKSFRKKVVDQIQDPVVKAFWVNEFAGYADKFASEAVSPIQNKVGQFLSSSLIRNIVGQVKSSIDIRGVMDEGKILLMNLSKGHIGEDNSALLGAMMITKIQLAAMSRVDIPEEERKDFYLYVDEFQNFATSSFANILSEARKYRLNLIMAHQYIEQLGEDIWAAVQGNVGTLVVFRVGAADAEILVKEFEPQYEEGDLVNLPKYNFYIKLMIDGVASNPFSAIGLPPKTKAEETGNTEKVIKISRERYAGQRDVVEEKIIRWHGLGEDNKEQAPGNDFKGGKKFEYKRQPPSGGQFQSSPQQFQRGPQFQNTPFSGQQTPTSYTQSAPKQKPNPQKIAHRFYDQPAPTVNSEQKENNSEPSGSPESDSGISLQDALNQGAVDFRGRKVANTLSASKESKHSVLSSHQNVIDKNEKKPQNNIRNGKLEEGRKVSV